MADNNFKRIEGISALVLLFGEEYLPKLEALSPPSSIESNGVSFSMVEGDKVITISATGEITERPIVNRGIEL